MNDNLISKLSESEMKKRYLKRYLDIKFYDEKKRKLYFDEIKKVDKEIERVKFKIRLNKVKKDVENSNTK